MSTLEIACLPTAYRFGGSLIVIDDLAELARELTEQVIESMMDTGLLARKESFGFAMAFPEREAPTWDDPESLIAFIMHWGPEGPRYAANAVRKIRPAARTLMDTQLMRMRYPEAFTDIVESQEPDGSFAWGDFPYDGAVHLNVLGRNLLGAVSAFPKEQDPVVAALILGAIGLEMHKADPNN